MKDSRGSCWSQSPIVGGGQLNTVLSKYLLPALRADRCICWLFDRVLFGLSAHQEARLYTYNARPG